MNKWLNAPVVAYTKTFGRTMHPVVYEVGSRDGHDGNELLTRISPSANHGQLVLFECNPPQVEVVRKNYPKAIVISDAISNEPGTVDFLQIEGDKNMRGSSSMDLSRVNEPWVKQTNIIQVPTRTLASVIEELGHQHIEIDIMKIDIEHYTWEALESLGQYLRNVKVFHLETESADVARNKTNLDIALYMQERGYICTALENEWGPHIQDQTWLRLDKSR